MKAERVRLSPSPRRLGFKRMLGCDPSESDKKKRADHSGEDHYPEPPTIEQVFLPAQKTLVEPEPGPEVWIAGAGIIHPIGDRKQIQSHDSASEDNWRCESDDQVTAHCCPLWPNA